MKIKISMVGGRTIEFSNDNYTSLQAWMNDNFLKTMSVTSFMGITEEVFVWVPNIMLIEEV